MGRHLRAVPAGEYDQVVRLAEFRAAHPEVIIGDLGFGGTWQARIPSQNGEQVVTRHVLKDLLDTLDALFGALRAPVRLAAPRWPGARRGRAPSLSPPGTCARPPL